jgi:hypothetical protein
MSAIRKSEKPRFAYHEDLEKVRESLQEFVVVSTENQTRLNDFQKSASRMLDSVTSQLDGVVGVMNRVTGGLKVIAWLFGSCVIILAICQLFKLFGH